MAPITHNEPDAGAGVLIPTRVRQALGLDNRQSWIIVDEINIFRWPGPDVRLSPKSKDGTPYYGQIPAALYEQVKTALISAYRSDDVIQTRRTEE